MGKPVDGAALEILMNWLGASDGEGNETEALRFGAKRLIEWLEARVAELSGQLGAVAGREIGPALKREREMLKTLGVGDDIHALAAKLLTERDEARELLGGALPIIKTAQHERGLHTIDGAKCHCRTCSAVIAYMAAQPMTTP